MADFANLADMIEKLPSRFNAEKAKGDKAILKFELAGDNGGAFWMNVNDGKLDMGTGDAPNKPDVTFRAAADDFLKIMNGELNPMNAFMFGKVKAEGAMGIAMKLLGWFGM